MNAGASGKAGDIMFVTGAGFTASYPEYGKAYGHPGLSEDVRRIIVQRQTTDFILGSHNGARS